MIKLYSISKEKTDILGLWKDNNKIYRDKIKIKSFCSLPRKEITKLFSQGEKAIFYTSNDKRAVCLNSDYSKQILYHCITWQENKLRPSLVKILLALHGGLTIYKNDFGYTLEIWK